MKNKKMKIYFFFFTFEDTIIKHFLIGHSTLNLIKKNNNIFTNEFEVINHDACQVQLNRSSMLCYFEIY